jgi:Spo0E like sporulation regulatory protein
MAKRLEQEFEVVRRKMEEAATRLGMDHPEVHRLSRRLDRLHNQMLWEGKALVEVPCRGRDRFYRIRRYSYYLREASEGCG